jgi:hypothetical protein
MAVVVSAAVAAEPTATPVAPAPRPTSDPPSTPTPASLRLDIDRHVEEMLDREVPRFRTEVVGRTPQEALEQQFHAFDTLCGAADRGAPNILDMAGQRPHLSPVLDLTQIITLLAQEGIKLLRKSDVDRFFVYHVARAGGGHFIVHDGRLSAAELYPPGAVVELVASFPDEKIATRAWWRLEHGYKTPVARRQRNPCAPR